MKMVILAFAIAFFGAVALLNWRKYRQTGDGAYLRAAILSFIMCIIPLLAFSGEPTLIIVALLLFIGAGIYALFMLLVESPRKNVIVAQIKSFDGKLTVKDALLTWKALAWLERKVGRVWAAIIYALIIASVTTACFASVNYLIQGDVNVYAVAEFLPVVFITFFSTGYRALLAAAGEKESPRIRALFSLLFILLVLLPVILVGVAILFMGHPVHVNYAILPITFDAHRGECGELVKQGWEYLRPKKNVVKFSAWVEGYCDPKGTVNAYGILEENHTIKVVVEYNGQVTRCFCPFHVTGVLKVPEELKSGEYNFILVFSVSPAEMEKVVDSKVIELSGACD